MITKNMTMEERLVVIKAAHKKFLKKKALKAKLAEGARKTTTFNLFNLLRKQRRTRALRARL